MVMATTIPAIVTVGGKSVIVGCLVFWALSRTRSLLIASKHSLWFFAFVMVFCLCLSMCVSPTVSSTQSTIDDLPDILYKVLESSPSMTILLEMGVSLWVSSSSSNGSTLDRSCSIPSRIGTTPLAYQTDLLSSCTNRFVASGCGCCS
jgi:hypothetical protein